MIALAKVKPSLRRTVFAVFIANEEASSVLGIGIDKLVAEGELERLKTGPLLWCDVADTKPCIGTGGVAAWTLRARGKLFHSGLPHLAINAIELANAGCAELQRRFYARTPPHEQEKTYGFATSSSMKPTQVSGQFGSVNQIAGEAVIHGDVRLTPFYSLDEVMRAIDADVADINAHVDKLPTIGPDSKFVLEAEGLRGKVRASIVMDILPLLACLTGALTILLPAAGAHLGLGHQPRRSVRPVVAWLCRHARCLC